MYKDPAKRKQAQKEWIAKKRAKARKNVCQNALQLTNSVEPDTNIPLVESNLSNPEFVEPNLPANYGQPDCECRHCQQARHSGNNLIINHGQRKSAEQLAANEVNRVSLPGDADYDGIFAPRRFGR